MGVEHPTAGDGLERRVAAEDEAVAARRYHRALQPKLHQPALPRHKRFVASERANTGEHLRGADVQMNPREILDRNRR